MPDLSQSPFPEAVRSMLAQRRQSTTSRAPSMTESATSKRPAEVDPARLREEVQQELDSSSLQPAPSPMAPASETLKVTREVLEMEAFSHVHPLVLYGKFNSWLSRIV